MVLAWLNGNASTPPAYLEFRSNTQFIVVTVALAVFTDVFLYGIVVPVLPFALTERSGIDPSQVQTWISTLLAVYGAALLAASPVCGYFADKTESRKLPLLVGLLALAGATVLLTVGNSIAVFVLGRLLQGFSAAVVWVVGLALLVDTVGSQAVGQCMGYVGLAMSLAVLLAPLIAGVVFDKAGYYAVFAIAFALLGVDIVLRLALIEKKVAARWIKDDLPSVAEGTQVEGDRTSVEGQDEEQGTAMRDLDGTSKRLPNHTADESRSSNSPNIADQEGAPLSAKRTWTSRMPPIVILLSSRRLTACLWGCLIQASLLTSFDSTLPIFVHSVFGWNSIGAGLVFLPIVISSFFGPLIGWASDKYGIRWLAGSGFILAVPCLILLRLVDHNSIRQKVLLCALLCLLGFTLNLVLTPLMAEIAYAVEATAAKRPKGFLGEKGAYAQAYGLFNVAFAGGCLVGPLVGGLVNQRAGWGATTLTLGILSAISAVPTLIWCGGSIFKQRRKEKEERVADLADPN